MSETFFEHEDAAQAAVVVVERVVPLEGNMEAQELFQAVWRSLVDTQKVGEGFADVLWRESEFAWLCAEAAGVQAAVKCGGCRWWKMAGSAAWCPWQTWRPRNKGCWRPPMP